MEEENEDFGYDIEVFDNGRLIITPLNIKPKKSNLYNPIDSWPTLEDRIRRLPVFIPKKFAE